MTSAATFPLLRRPRGNGPFDLVPLLPATLSLGKVVFDVHGLVDSGATFNVLPFDVGNRFGIPWNSLTRDLQLGGVAGLVPAKAIDVEFVVSPFPPIQLLFAWAQTNAFPIILGQADFFLRFDVCFFRKQGNFQILPSTP